MLDQRLYHKEVPVDRCGSQGIHGANVEICLCWHTAAFAKINIINVAKIQVGVVVICEPTCTPPSRRFSSCSYGLFKSTMRLRQANRYPHPLIPRQLPRRLQKPRIRWHT